MSGCAAPAGECPAWFPQCDYRGTPVALTELAVALSKGGREKQPSEKEPWAGMLHHGSV